MPGAPTPLMHLRHQVEIGKEWTESDPEPVLEREQRHSRASAQGGVPTSEANCVRCCCMHSRFYVSKKTLISRC